MPIAPGFAGVAIRLLLLAPVVDVLALHPVEEEGGCIVDRNIDGLHVTVDHIVGADRGLPLEALGIGPRRGDLEPGAGPRYQHECRGEEQGCELRIPHLITGASLVVPSGNEHRSAEQ